MQIFQFDARDCTTHASTDTTSLIHVKNKTPPSAYNICCLGYCNEENERKIKNIKLNSYHFSLTLVNCLLA